jgi:hypothetical protein
MGLDCNRNQRSDLCEIQESSLADANGNEVLEECETLAAFLDGMSGPGVHTSPQNPIRDAALCREAFVDNGDGQVDPWSWWAYLAAYSP